MNVIRPPGLHRVQWGDSLSRVAAIYGFKSWQTIWNQPENAAFRKANPDPYLIHPGTDVFIPTQEPRWFPVRLDAVNRFALEQEPSYLSLCLFGKNGIPLCDAPFEIAIDGGELENRRTDSEGEAVIPAHLCAQSAQLIIFKKPFVLDLGDVVPQKDTILYVQWRLNQIGYRLTINDRYDDDTKSAIRRFQRDVGLPATGVVDAKTQQTLDDADWPYIRTTRGKIASRHDEFIVDAFVVNFDYDRESKVLRIEVSPGNTMLPTEDAVKLAGSIIVNWTDVKAGDWKVWGALLVAAQIVLSTRIYTVKDHIEATVTRDPEVGLNVIAERPREFVFLDVGLWRGYLPRGHEWYKPRQYYSSQRSFGVIHDDFVLLCSYELTSSFSELRIDRSLTDLLDLPPVLDGFLRHLGDVNEGYQVVIHRREYLGGMRSTNSRIDPDRIYLILPDLHLPVWTKAPKDCDLQAALGRPPFEPWLQPKLGEDKLFELYLMNETFRREFDRQRRDQWYKDYARCVADVFWSANVDEQGRAGSPEYDLVKLLKRLEDYQKTVGKAKRKQVHLVQIGDMYELWIGLERFWMHRPWAYDGKDRRPIEDAERVELTDAPDVRRTIQEWIDLTNENFEELTTFLKKAEISRESYSEIKKTFLWGNHDSYFATGAYGLPERIKTFDPPGIYMEHGHNNGADLDNRDGAIDGHNNVRAFFSEFAAFHVPLVRSRHVLSSAVTFLNTNETFLVYVMGHTHSPVLSRVRIFG